MTITVLGLGPGDPRHLTREAWELLSHQDEIYVRTTRHPTVATLPDHLTIHSFDHLYEASDSFAEVYQTIAAQVLALARRPRGVFYAVPGHPLVGETSVKLILAQAAQEGLDVRIIEGLSFVEPVLSQLGIDALDGLQLADATELASSLHPLLDPDRPALIGQLYSRRLAGELKLTLLNAYPADLPVTLVSSAGAGATAYSDRSSRLSQEQPSGDDATDRAVAATSDSGTFPLFELDRESRFDHLTTLYLPPLAPVSGMAGLQQTVARLRAPDGCPWDREQTHRTLSPHLLEETYEVLAAIDSGDADLLCEELGDLLMQIAMHAQIAAEEGEFLFADVVRRIDAKLKRRHPHVFGDVRVEGVGDVLRNWEAIKADERAASNQFGRTESRLGVALPAGPGVAGPDVLEGHTEYPSRLGDVPRILPALARAQSLGERAARHGFDWSDVDGVLDKVVEEVSELRATADPRARAQELGDLLFALTNLARWLALDAEGALRQACDRFVRRYARMEQLAHDRGLDLGTLALSDQDALWEEIKGGSGL